MTQYSANAYHSKPVFNPFEGLVGLSYSLKASACSIIQSPIYNDSKTEKAKMVYDAALELTELVKRYHLSNAKAA